VAGCHFADASKDPPRRLASPGEGIVVIIGFCPAVRLGFGEGGVTTPGGEETCSPRQETCVAPGLQLDVENDVGGIEIHRFFLRLRMFAATTIFLGANDFADPLGISGGTACRSIYRQDGTNIAAELAASLSAWWVISLSPRSRFLSYQIEIGIVLPGRSRSRRYLQQLLGRRNLRLLQRLLAAVDPFFGVEVFAVGAVVVEEEVLARR